MRSRVIALFLVAVFLLTTSYAFAGGSGDCILPLKQTTKFLKTGGAYEYNYVAKRENELQNSQSSMKDLEIRDQWQSYGKITVGVLESTNLYAKIGVTNYKMKMRDKNNLDRVVETQLNDGIYTGLGTNSYFKLADVKPVTFGIGFDLQGNFSHNSISDIFAGGVRMVGVDGTVFAADGEESLYLTCKYDVKMLKTSIIPYVGGYHSWLVVGSAEPVSARFQPETGHWVQNKAIRPGYDVLSFGVLVGCDLDIASFFNLNVEGRFGGETALTTGATFKF